MDDFVPTQYDKPAFSNTIGNELWVVLLEKAWAKVHGSYEKIEAGRRKQPANNQRIEAGQAHYTLRDLTGAPSYQYFNENTPNIFDIILEAC